MFNDSEANRCYSLKSLVMPEEIIDLNAIAAYGRPSNSSNTSREVTFNQVHSILYGDPSTKLIYDNAQKYFNKTLDLTYPHTYLRKDVFSSIIQKIHPSLKLQFVVEIGSFTGNSALNIGNVLKESYPGSFLLCIDTWLGDLNMWVNKVVWEHLSVSEDGRPTVYYQFLTNIIKQNLTKIVLPASMTSIIGARFLQTYQFHPQVIYLDSAHEQGETLIELSLYWNLLEPGGILIGDDWVWHSVRCDVKKFSYMKNLTIERAENTWIIKKPVD
ncbi:unnamed protein product [Adineta steineri]|uniref:Class I SAM-dependent methyltransferase n=1 Tax=Adineta steineri TaxID=433720 RepID=A0A818PDW8_9BILA|nr:unnamed protein product [Adineta steineri]CAF1255228.1 unnamed protein product [Adineta steineri]CAF3618603.1 unnamed protein product [Adineta steineri]CAF4194889.1 unnamed protein product [Adineta steineri]